jgi:hypothetical protein
VQARDGAFVTIKPRLIFIIQGRKFLGTKSAVPIYVSRIKAVGKFHYNLRAPQK